MPRSTKKLPDSPLPITGTRTKRVQKIHHEPTELEYEILTYVMDYRAIPVWQLVNLHFSKGSKTRANTLLQLLAGQSKDTPSEPYLYRDALDKKTPGNPVFLYFLGTDGINYLRANGYPDLTRRFRPSETQEISYNAKIHLLNVNDVLIAGRNLPQVEVLPSDQDNGKRLKRGQGQKIYPDIFLVRWLHDFDKKDLRSVVEFDRRRKEGGQQRERVTIEPDGMLHYAMQLNGTEGKKRERIILPEIDRGTETNIEEFKAKIRAYVHYAMPDGPFEELFGKVNKRVAWIVTKGGENRLSTLRKWCEDELADQDVEEEYNLFRFTTVEQVVEVDKQTGEQKKREELNIDPSIFVSSVWYKPYHETPDTLLWKL